MVNKKVKAIAASVSTMIFLEVFIIKPLLFPISAIIVPYTYYDNNNYQKGSHFITLGI